MFKVGLPKNVIYGKGELANIAKYLDANGWKKAFLLTDPAMIKTGVADKVKEYAGDRVVAVSSDVDPDPTIQNVDNNLVIVKETGADCIIALGGGSTIDCAKCIAVAVADGVDGETLLTGHRVGSMMPVIAIPTTAGTGSEVTGAGSINDKETGRHGGVFGVLTNLAIVDPELTYTVPKAVTANTGFDVLAHALDALTNKFLNPFVRPLAVAAVKTALENLPKAVNNGDDHQARDNMAVASLLAGMAFGQIGTSASHASAFVLSGPYNLPHGEACALTLDAWMRVDAKLCPQVDEIAQEIGFDNMEKLADRLLEMKKEFGMVTNLSQLGITEADIDRISRETAANGSLTLNVVMPDLDTIKEMYKSIL